MQYISSYIFRNFHPSDIIDHCNKTVLVLRFSHKINITMHSSKIKRFLSEYDFIILDEHRKQLLDLQAELEGKEYEKSIQRGHLRTCPWSLNNAVEGPDTCECQISGNRNAEKLMKLYYRLTTNFPSCCNI